MAESVDRIARLAGALAGLGVQRGDRVGILALNSDRYQEYFHAVPWMRAAINPVNIRWSAAEIAYSLVESDTRVLFVDDACAPMIPAQTLIAGYKAPRSVDFVDGLPMSGASKILKRALRERYWDDSGNQVS